MKNKLLYWVVFTASIMVCYSSESFGNSSYGDYIIEIESGDNWIHKFNIFIKTAPQYAIWIENEEGEYCGTIFLTRKIATEGWILNGGNRRVESLPIWSHKRNVKDSSGILNPSTEEPFIDGGTGATPKGDSDIKFKQLLDSSGFRVCLEVNQSTDFNSYWTKNAVIGEPNWSGGKYGSGQPSLIYSAWVEPSDSGPWILNLIGHGSPDGSNGEIYTNLEYITTAEDIIKSVIIRSIN